MSTCLRTLVLEDQPDDYTLLMHELRRAGFEPVGKRVETAEEFLAHLDPEVDIVFSDYTMPGFNGLEALRLMKRRKIDVPFIFVSGTIGEEVAVAAMQEGAADYLMKDRLGRLGPAVKKILAQWRLQEEKQLAEQAAARLAAIVESSSDAIIATTLEGAIVTWNTAAEQLYGYTADEIVGKDIALLVPAGRRQNDVLEDHGEMARRLQSGERIEAYETVRVRKNGRRVDVEVTISPIRDANEAVLGASFIAHDIGRRKRAEHFLSAEHAVTRILAESRTLEEASPHLLHALADSLRWEAAVLWKVDSEANVLRRVHTWHAPWAEGSFVDQLDQLAVLELDFGMAGRAWARGEPSWEPCSPVSADGQAGAPRLRAAISIPMRLECQMVSAIEFYNPELQQPDADMIAALANITSQITQFSERRQNEAALRASEERYRSLIAASAAIVWGTPASGEFETEQPQWTAFTGQTFDQLRGWGWLNAVHPEDQENTRRIWLEAWHGRAVYEVEHRLRRADGEYRHMSMRAVPMIEPGGAIREWVGVHTDVTEQKRAEEAVRASEKEFRTLAEAVPQLVWITRPDGWNIYFNQQWTDYTGLSLEETLGDGWNKPFHPEEKQKAWDAWQNATTTLSTYSLECRLRRADGIYRWWLIRGEPLKDTEGKIVKWFGTCTEIDDIKQAEEKLRKSEARFKAIIEKGYKAVALLDIDGTIRYVSPAIERISGRPPQDYLGTKIFAWKHPDEVAAHAAGFADFAQQPGLIFSAESRLRHRDGSWRWVESTFTNLLADADVQAIVLNMRDITERRQAEAVLELRERAIAAVSQGILITDATAPDNPIVYASPGFQRLTGYNYQEVLGRNCRFLLGKDTDPAARGQIRAALVEGRSCNVELLNYRKDGTTFWNNVTVAPILDTSGQLTHFVGVQSDVTERRQLEEQFRHTQRRLQNVVASSPAVLFTLGFADNRIQGMRWISENVLGIFGYPLAAALTPGWWMSNIYPEDRDRTVSITHAELLRDGGSTHEYRFRHGDGAYRWTRADLRLIRDETGEAIEVVGAWSDISEHRQLEEQFHQAQKMDAFGQLAGGVAHDFNNLLTIINGYGDIVMRSLAPENKLRGFVSEILKAGERSASLTGQLLAFSRKQVVTLKILDLNTVVNDTEKMLQRIIGEDIELTTLLSADLGAVRADVGQVEQILLNLAVNARDAMPEGGKFLIETKNIELDDAYTKIHVNARPGSYVLLAARDTGCGMTDEIKARIFEPFFTTKGVGKGTGLGLATVYGIVNQADGYIEVQSKVDVGTSFKIYLPRVKGSVTEGVGRIGTASIPHGTESILLVEDEDGLRGLLREVLTECGYSVAAAANGMAALQMAKERRGLFDLVVSDVVMPGMGGRLMVEQLVTLYPKLKVMYVSGYTDDAIVRHGILHDQVPFLQKPFSPSTLARKIREVLDS